MLSMTLWLLTVLVPLQILIGDLHGLNTLEHQPAKLAAMEAHWETGARVPLILFAIPDQAAETQPLRDRGAAARQPDPDACRRRRGARG